MHDFVRNIKRSVFSQSHYKLLVHFYLGVGRGFKKYQQMNIHMKWPKFSAHIAHYSKLFLQSFDIPHQSFWPSGTIYSDLSITFLLVYLALVHTDNHSLFFLSLFSIFSFSGYTGSWFLMGPHILTHLEGICQKNKNFFVTEGEEKNWTFSFFFLSAHCFSPTSGVPRNRVRTHEHCSQEIKVNLTRNLS